MKRGSKKLLIFEILIIIMLLLNNFVSSILRGYIEVIFIIGLLAIFYFIYGYTKDRHHLWKNVFLDIIIFLLIFFMLYYLLGILLSFAKVNNYYTVSGILNVLIPLILTIILKEIFRYMVVSKTFGDKLLLVITCILFICLDLVGKFNVGTFSGKYDTFIFIATVFLPIVSRNILCTYLSYNVGYKPTLLYVFVTSMYGYLLPIIPNPNQYIYSIIWLVLPMVLMYRLYKYFGKETHDIKIERDYHKHRFGTLIIPTVFIVILVYFVSGYFHYHAVVIASGSMEKVLSKGDVVIIEKIDDPTTIELKEIIAYRYNKIIVVHRLVKRIEVNGETIFYTKGDANQSMDDYKITMDMVIGTVNFKIPYIGYPTVWVNEL
jgi:signal peptidase